MPTRLIPTALAVLIVLSGMVRFDSLAAGSHVKQPIFKMSGECPLQRCSVRWDRGADLSRLALGRDGVLFMWTSDTGPWRAFSLGSAIAPHRASPWPLSLHCLQVKLQV